MAKKRSEFNHSRSYPDRQEPHAREEITRHSRIADRRHIDTPISRSPSLQPNALLMPDEVVREIFSRLDQVEQKISDAGMVMVTQEEYQLLLERIEDLEDIIAFDTAKAAGEQPIPWEQALADIERAHPELRKARQ